MIKMMLTVVIVFTICWLPFNTLLVMWTNDENLGDWTPMPYIWFVLHWLALSHSCYNPIIYCYMNARFRDGFAHILEKCPCLRRCLPPPSASSGRERSSGGQSMHPLTGMDDNNSVLNRVNTCSTYFSIKRKHPMQCSCVSRQTSVYYDHNNVDHGQYGRSSSVRNSFHTRRFQNKLDTYPEDQI